MHPDDLVIAAGAVAAALIAIGVVTRGVWRMWRKFDAFFDTWFGQPERPGQPAVLGIPERVHRLELSVRQIRKQVTPNGGHTETLGDKVVRIEHQLGTEQPDQTGGE